MFLPCPSGDGCRKAPPPPPCKKKPQAFLHAPCACKKAPRARKPLYSLKLSHVCERSSLMYAMGVARSTHRTQRNLMGYRKIF